MGRGNQRDGTGEPHAPNPPRHLDLAGRHPRAMSPVRPTQEAPVLDAAFGLAKQAVPPLGHAEAKDHLRRMFPALSYEEISEHYLRAAALADACYDAGDQCRDRRMTDAQAVASLRQRFPGFSAETYEQALSWGYFISR